MKIAKCSARSLMGLGVLGLCLTLGTTAYADGLGGNGKTVSLGNGLSVHERANIALGLESSTLFQMDLNVETGDPFSVQVPLGRHWSRIDLDPHSIRADSYQVLVAGANGALTPVAPGPINTYRGWVRGLAGSLVSGGIEPTGLHMQIIEADGNQWWVEPIGHKVEGANANDYVLYNGDAVLDHGHHCGNDAMKPMKMDEIIIDGGGNAAQGGGQPCVAVHAADADFEYFQDYGSVGAVEARINSVMNTVNVQYENQCGLTHAMGTIIVRTQNNDPYTSSNYEVRLCQFITEWTNNQGGIDRDVAQLFTGIDIDGGVIGVAADIGGTGICVNNGGCNNCGPFGTCGSYCMSQSDFNGDFSCATDLSAHELGHLWGAFHCNCPSNTMNSFITCANSFSGSSIASITSYAATRTCLDGQDCGGGGPTGPENDDCGDAEVLPGNGDYGFSTLLATTDGPSHGQCDFDGQTYEDVWYEYTALCDGSLTVSTCDQADYDTDLVIYDGCNCNNLNFLACNDDAAGCGGFTSEITVNVVEGDCYLIRVGGWNAGDEGTGTLTVDGPDPCAPATGACCVNGGCVDNVTEANCIAGGGEYQGDGTTCGGSQCTPTGACCLPNGNCVEGVEQATCEAAGGEYQGDDTDCGGVDCTPTGACCLADGNCVDGVTAVQCAAGGGNYQGDNTDCGSVTCPLPCPCDFVADGVVNVSDLLFMLGEWGGPNGDCTGDGTTDVSDILELLGDWGPC